MSRHVLDCLGLTAIAAVVFFTNLGGPPLWDRDEPRNAGCAAEMLEAGDWVTPVFNEELRTHKPILLYWCMMAAYTVFGVGEFGARFTSATLGVVTVLLTYGIGCRLFHRRVGLWASIILPTTILFSVAARAATPDALLICCATMSLAFFAFGAFPAKEGNEEHFRPRPWAMAGFYASMGLGVLAKGPVGFVLPTAIVGTYLLIMRLPGADEATPLPVRLRRWLAILSPTHLLKTAWIMRPISGTAIIGAVALPWYAWVHVRTNGEWTNGFFWTHNLERATSVMEGHSGPPVLFYVVAILVGCFPWSILTVSTTRHLWQSFRSGSQQSSERAGIVFLLCWVGTYVVIFSLAQTKLPSYVTPCYPALAILIGFYVDHWVSSPPQPLTWLKVGFANLVIVGAGVAIGIGVAARYFLPGAEWLALIGVVLLLGGLVGWTQLSRPRWSAMSLTATALVFILFLHAIVAHEIGRRQQYASMLATARRHAGSVIALGQLEPSWVFYGQRPIVEFSVDAPDTFVDYVAQNPDTLVITTEEKLSETLGAGFATSFQVIDTAEYFLRDRKLLLLRADPAQIAGLAAHSGNLNR